MGEGVDIYIPEHNSLPLQHLVNIQLGKEMRIRSWGGCLSRKLESRVISGFAKVATLEQWAAQGNKPLGPVALFETKLLP